MMTTIKRGDIFYANLNPVVGSEQGDTRPCLVVQNNVGNQHSPTVVIIPLTSSKKATQPTHAEILRIDGLALDSIALAEQIRTIDRKRLDGYIGQIDSGTQVAVDSALAVSIGLVKEVKSHKTGLDLCLCCRCVSDCENSGYFLVKRGWQDKKEPCDICKVGIGWEFWVFDRESDERR